MLCVNFCHFFGWDIEEFDSWNPFNTEFHDGFYCQNRIRVGSLETCFGQESLYSSANTITSTFAMGCGKEVPFGVQAKVLLVVAKIDEVMFVLILPSTAIREVVDFLYYWELLLNVLNHHLLESIHSRG
ncbi:unnamed protein product [Clavelina lepadiformis]|uniref:Uncharacterized protein n=1 Tax=Clavelina lepadiformis TaxID=159417 RepID=A0ABP0GZW7_CLALP